MTYQTNLIENPRNISFNEGDITVAGKLIRYNDEKDEYEGKDLSRYWRIYFLEKQYFYEDGIYKRTAKQFLGTPCGYNGIKTKKEDIDAMKLLDASCHPWDKHKMVTVSGTGASSHFSTYSMRVFDCRSYAENPEKECESFATI